MVRTMALAALLAGCMQQSVAQQSGASTGPVIDGFGRAFGVEAASPLPEEARFKVVFDVAESRAPGELNRGLESVARFLNMHGKAGLPADRMELAVVVHGQATKEMQTSAAAGITNENVALIEALLAAGVRVEVCGQSASALGVAAEDLVPGVAMALSAMTAHALLQQEGYTLNPF